MKTTKLDVRYSFCKECGKKIDLYYLTLGEVDFIHTGLCRKCRAKVLAQILGVKKQDE